MKSLKLKKIIIFANTILLGKIATQMINVSKMPIVLKTTIIDKDIKDNLTNLKFYNFN